MPRSLRDSLTRYIDHLEDAAWIESLVAEHGLASVLRSCVDVLTEQSPAEVQEVTTLLLDIGRRGIVEDDLVAEVRALMPAGVLPALRRLLVVPHLQVRMTAISAIGRLSFAAEAAALREVFSSYIDHDPICLARLLGELQWLGDRRGVAARMKRVVGHKNYLLRWSALGYFDCSSPPWQRATCEPMLRALSRDPAPSVATEARYQLAELELEAAGEAVRWLPKAKWRNKRRALEKRRPPMTFSVLEGRFLNDMRHRGQSDFALEELDAFARSLRTPPTTGEEISRRR